MNTEDESKTKSKNNGRIITVAIIWASVGVAFMSRLPQNLPQAIPWYQSGFFWVGIGIVVIASLILVPPEIWKSIWQFVKGFRTWSREMKIWKCYGPACTFGEPNITCEFSEGERIKVYTAKISLSISLLEKTRDYYPIKVLVDKNTTMFHLEQSRGGVKVPPATLELVPGTIKQTLINTPSSTTIGLVFSWSPLNIPSNSYVDVQKPPYEWIIEGIEVHLDNINKVRKLSKRGKVSNVEKGIS